MRRGRRHHSAGRGRRRHGRPCSTAANVGVGGLHAARQADRACVAGHGGEVGGDEEDEVGEQRLVAGAAAARDKAGAAAVESLSDMVSVMPLCFVK